MDTPLRIPTWRLKKAARNQRSAEITFDSSGWLLSRLQESVNYGSMGMVSPAIRWAGNPNARLGPSWETPTLVYLKDRRVVYSVDPAVPTNNEMWFALRIELHKKGDGIIVKHRRTRTIYVVTNGTNWYRYIYHGEPYHNGSGSHIIPPDLVLHPEVRDGVLELINRCVA